MATFEDDGYSFPHAVGLLDALSAELTKSQLEVPCTMLVAPGQLVTFDYAGECKAMGWTRLASVYPSTTSFPNADATALQHVALATTVELGLVRPHPIPDNGEAPTDEELYEVARLTAADMGAMFRAICGYADPRGIDVFIQSYVPIGPDGGAVGGAWTATFGML